MFFRQVLFGILIMAIVGLGIFVVRGKYEQKADVGRVTTMVLRDKTFSLEVSDTEALREQGLSGHVPLTDTQGMLFVFEKLGNWGFWMKDMTFSLDIIWFDLDLRVVHVEKMVSPQTYPKVFYPEAPSQYVLEINSGISDAIDLKIGDQAKFMKSSPI